MSNSAATFALGVATVATGGGTLAIVKFILTKRSAMAGMDATASRENAEAERAKAEAEKIRAEADKLRREAADGLAAGLAEIARIQVERNKELEKRIDKLLGEAADASKACEERVVAAVRARQRMVREVAELRTDLDIAREEIRLLKSARDGGDDG